MSDYMLDTNICSYILREKPAQVLMAFEEAAESGSRILISAMTYFELLHGAVRPKAPKGLMAEIEELLCRLDEVAPIDAEVVKTAATVQGKLFRQGCPIGQADALIAGHALVNDCVLVTHNTREFSRVEGLEVEDWALLPDADA